MRRLVRRLFTLCSAASLLLCVTAAFLWPVSYGYWCSASYSDETVGAEYFVTASTVGGRLILHRNGQMGFDRPQLQPRTGGGWRLNAMRLDPGEWTWHVRTYEEAVND